MLPVESLEALCPSSAGVGSALLRPMTLAHAVAFEMLRLPLSPRGIGAASAIPAAFILSMDGGEALRRVRDGGCGICDGMEEWAADGSVSAEEAMSAVRKQLGRVEAAGCPVKSSGDATQTVGCETGFGWVIEYAEAAMVTFHMELDAALTMPLVTMIALFNCEAKRNGAEFGGPDYYERIYSAILKGRGARDGR